MVRIDNVSFKSLLKSLKFTFYYSRSSLQFHDSEIGGDVWSNFSYLNFYYCTEVPQPHIQLIWKWLRCFICERSIWPVSSASAIWKNYFFIPFQKILDDLKIFTWVLSLQVYRKLPSQKAPVKFVLIHGRRLRK